MVSRDNINTDAAAAAACDNLTSLTRHNARRSINARQKANQYGV